MLDNQKVQYTITLGPDAKGNPGVLQPGDSIAVTSSDTDSCSVVPDDTPVAGSAASGFIVAGAKLQTGVVITATLTFADGSAPETASGSLDVTGGEPGTLSIGFGAPVNQ